MYILNGSEAIFKICKIYKYRENLTAVSVEFFIVIKNLKNNIMLYQN